MKVISGHGCEVFNSPGLEGVLQLGLNRTGHDFPDQTGSATQICRTDPAGPD